MRTLGLSTPNAAELYFNNSLIGQISTLFAEALGRSRSARNGGTKAPSGGANRSAEPPVVEQRGWLDRLDSWFWRREQEEREAYLARSRDVFELERRIAALARGPIGPYY